VLGELLLMALRSIRLFGSFVSLVLNISIAVSQGVGLLETGKDKLVVFGEV
jgi:hypothetical protein